MDADRSLFLDDWLKGRHVIMRAKFEAVCNEVIRLAED